MTHQLEDIFIRQNLEEEHFLWQALDDPWTPIYLYLVLLNYLHSLYSLVAVFFFYVILYTETVEKQMSQ